ncbi:MAG: shikimate kinase [Clostridia bacterium]|nr:shikimate kinase [Clostridia bacterium]
MKYGCIGEKLGHSFSKDIHGAIAPYEYELCEIRKDKLSDYMEKMEFSAINVTIPYKEQVIPFLSEISDKARLIGAVNTVVNRDGKLFGYNTDFYGMSSLIEHMGLSLDGKKVAILGSGGTSKTAYAVAKEMKASEIVRVSRSGKDGAVTYDELYRVHCDSEIIINTTPCGMYPNPDGIPLDLDKMPCVKGIVDAVYNPLRTRLVSEGLKRGISASGGLYMLVAQAVRASEIFLDKEYPTGTTDDIYKKILSEKENIILVGMPGCGKTTVGELIARELGRTVIDTDSEIISREEKEISDIFAEIGESGFRDIEAEVIKDRALSVSGAVISTGGGAILRESNVDALRQNGRLYFIDRPLEALIPTDDRPTANTAEAIKKRYEERYPTYLKVCDIRIDGSKTPNLVADDIIREHKR